MSQKVFEGQAELNVKPFIDAVTNLQLKTASAVNDVSRMFNKLDINIATAVKGIRTNVQAAIQDINALGKALAGVKTPNVQKPAAAGSGGGGVPSLQRAQDRIDDARNRAVLNELKNRGAQEVRLYREKMQEIIRNAKYYDELALRQTEARLAKERQMLEKSLETKKKILQADLDAQKRAQEDLKDALAKGDKAAANVAHQMYRDMVHAAQLSAQEQKDVQKQLSAVIRAETEVGKRALHKLHQDIAEQAHRAALSGAQGIRAQFAALQEEMKRVEDRWNSIFRAGSQLSSLGRQMTGFASQITQTGLNLSNNAGDFDFWIARTKAAMQAAGSDEAVASIDVLRDRVLKLGRELGSLDPAQLAEGWFTYQAAIGTTITSIEDLEIAQEAISTMLKAGIISDSDPATVMRGVAGVLAAYRLETDQASYATSVLMNVTQRTQAEFNDLLEAYKMVGSNAAVMNANIAETSTLMALMAEQNIKGSQAGRSLNMVYSRLLDPTKEANEALNQILITSQGLEGTWRDVAFAGGSFIGMLGEVDAQGNVIKEGFVEKFVQPFMSIPKAIRDTKIGEAIGKIFPENAARGILPIMIRYADALEEVRQGGDNAKNSILQMYAEFANGQTQANLFTRQWQTVSESIRLRLDNATYGIREGLVRIGVIVAETMVPIVEKVSEVVTKFADWAQENPKLATALVTVIAAITALAAVIGPLLIAIGTALQGFAGLAVAQTALSGGLGVLFNAFTRLGPAILGLVRGVFPMLIGAIGSISLPMWGLIALIALLAAAWYNNWGGFGDFMNGLVGVIGTAFQSIGDIIGGVLKLIVGLVTGDTELIREAFEGLATSIIELLIVLPMEIGELFGDLVYNMGVWGYNLMVSMANGIAEGAEKFIWPLIDDIALGIAAFFRSYSPPKYGPLKGIYEWGRNLIKTFIEGMNTADIDAVSSITERIADALKINLEHGDITTGIDQLSVLFDANELAAQMIGILQNGGRVTADFFSSLRDGLGEWYGDVVEILMAYQELYAVQNNLRAEQERLKLIQAQRKELEAQNKLRQDAFDAYLSSSDGASYENNQQYVVDPTTKEGKAEIERMRRTLTVEDFQTWINFQKRMWQQKADAEDKALETQESAAQAAVDAYTKQLEIVQAQYDYLVKMYDYAKGLLELAKKTEEAGAKGGGGGGGGRRATPKQPTTGSPADLEEARRRIREIVGEDQAIYDEQKLREMRGGDDIGALDDAAAQKKRELDRLTALENENRRRRAQYETDLINATSDEERARIKQTMDAWDAAYKEEKSRLTERKQLTQEIAEAADQQAELSASARIEEQRAVAEQEILTAMGGQLETQGGLQQEERKLQDLRNLGDRKRLEFERRLREARGNEAQIRKIKEEQQAWEEAYKAAVQAQEERVQALRRAEQDTRAARAGGGARAGVGGGGIPDLFSYDGETPARFDPRSGRPPYASGMDQIRSARSRRAEKEELRPSLQKAGNILEKAKLGWDFLNSDQFDIQTKIKTLYEALFTPPPEVEARKQEARRVTEEFDRQTQENLQKGWNTFWAVISTGFSLWWNNEVSEWNRFWGGISEGASRWWDNEVRGWNRFWEEVGNAASTWWDNEVRGWNRFWEEVGNGSRQWMEDQGKNWNKFWILVGMAWSAFSGWFMGVWNGFWGWVADVWTGFWNWVGGVWTGFWNWIGGVWNGFWNWVGGLWTSFWSWLSDEWNSFWTILTTLWGLFRDGLSLDWDVLWLSLMVLWDIFKGFITGDWTLLWDILKGDWQKFVKDFNAKVEEYKKGLDKVKEGIQNIVDGISGWVGNLLDAARRLFGGGKKDGGTDGSHAGGLYRVPFDGYRAELHAGERVLTAEEAARYNQLEAGGLLDALSSFVDRASAAVSRAMFATAAVPVTINEGSTVKTTTINIGTVEASNPNAGRAFLQQLAFLG